MNKLIAIVILFFTSISIGNATHSKVEVTPAVDWLMHNNIVTITEWKCGDNVAAWVVEGVLQNWKAAEVGATPGMRFGIAASTAEEVIAVSTTWMKGGSLVTAASNLPKEVCVVYNELLKEASI